MAIFESFKSHDSRGQFQKIFPSVGGELTVSNFEIKELFWSRSQKGVIRGLHFQSIPHEQEKIVWVSEGSIIDVIVDLNSGNNFGKITSYLLSEENGNYLHVPKGFAHGFQVISDTAIVNYAANHERVASSEEGILWSSIDFDWPLSKPVVSDRDSLFLPFGRWSPLN